MTDNLEELKAQANAINKKIRALEAKGDADVNALIEEIQQPGSYLQWGNGWVIKPTGGYRKENKKSVEFKGCSLHIDGSVPYPYFNAGWSSSGYDIKDFKKLLNKNEIKVFHDPKNLLSEIDRQQQKMCNPADVLRQILISLPDKSDVDIKAFLKLKRQEAVDLAIATYDGVIVKKPFSGPDSRNLDEFHILRFVDAGDGTVFFKIISVYPVVFRSDCTCWFFYLDETRILQVVRTNPSDRVSKNLLHSNLKKILTDATVATVSDLEAYKDRAIESFDLVWNEFKAEVQKAICVEESK